MKVSVFKKGSAVFGLAALLAAQTQPARAQSSRYSSDDSFGVDDYFRSGWHEATTGAGVMFSPIAVTINRPTVNYGLAYVQAAYMIDDVSGDDWLRGNFEVAPEIFGAGIWHRSGNYIAGWTLWGRYNFVPRNWRLTPFIQLGAGAVLTDISHQYDGQNFNFNLDAAVGARYFIRKNISIDAEFRYQHISNADTGRRNIGINAIGPVVGVSWFF